MLSYAIDRVTPPSPHHGGLAGCHGDSWVMSVGLGKGGSRAGICKETLRSEEQWKFSELVALWWVRLVWDNLGYFIIINCISD